jgi:hypothetical protein
MAINDLIISYTEVPLTVSKIIVNVDKLLLKDWEPMLRIYTGLVFRIANVYNFEATLTNEKVKEELPAICASILMESDEDSEGVMKDLIEFFKFFIKSIDDLESFLKGLIYEDFEALVLNIYEVNKRPFSFRLQKMVSSGVLTREVQEQLLTMALKENLKLTEESNPEDSSIPSTDAELTQQTLDLL